MEKSADSDKTECKYNLLHNQRHHYLKTDFKWLDQGIWSQDRRRESLAGGLWRLAKISPSRHILDGVSIYKKLGEWGTAVHPLSFFFYHPHPHPWLSSLIHFHLFLAARSRFLKVQDIQNGYDCSLYCEFKTNSLWWLHMHSWYINIEEW